ncbi:MAG: phage tail protein, partial [Dehalococcoidia bacterium]|nr:phage tail protein [Dehalococcoidia bacterium]
LLYDRWISRNTYQLSLPRKYFRLEPTDIINVPSVGPLRILNRKDSDGVLTFDCVAEDTTLYSLAGVGASLPSVNSDVSQAGPTISKFLDIPLLRDIDDGPGFYIAANGYYAGWSGCELWRSTDGGASYVRTDTALLTGAAIGSALTALATAPTANVFDEANSVDVQLINGTLSSATALEVLNGANAAYLAGEVIQFKTATLLDTNKYRLSGLRRARCGTEQYMSTHAIGDTFVLLNTSSIGRVVHATADIGLERIYKTPSIGQLVADAAPQSLTSASVGQKCLSPVGLAAGRTANASWDISGKWIPRTRIGGEWRDGVDITMGEASEAYEVEIWTSGFATLKRTITSVASGAGSVVTPGSRTFLYRSADQVTDFGSNQSTIYIKVYQLSAVTGRGFPAQGTLTV